MVKLSQKGSFDNDALPCHIPIILFESKKKWVLLCIILWIGAEQAKSKEGKTIWLTIYLIRYYSFWLINLKWNSIHLPQFTSVNRLGSVGIIALRYKFTLTQQASFLSSYKDWYISWAFFHSCNLQKVFCFLFFCLFVDGKRLYIWQPLPHPALLSRWIIILSILKC